MVEKYKTRYEEIIKSDESIYDKLGQVLDMIEEMDSKHDPTLNIYREELTDKATEMRNQCAREIEAEKKEIIRFAKEKGLSLESLGIDIDDDGDDDDDDGFGVDL